MTMPASAPVEERATRSVGGVSPMGDKTAATCGCRVREIRGTP